MDLENGMNRREARDDERVRELLRDLPRVEAPANFEFRVKAGIAENRSSSSKGAWIPFATRVAPLALVLVVIGGVLFYASNSTSPDSRVVEVPQSSIDPGPKPRLTEDVAVSEPVPSSAITSSESQPVRNVDRSPVVRPRRRTTSADEGTSRDIIQRSTNVIMPPGTESANPRNRNMNPTVSTTSGRPVLEVLEIMGIDAEYSNAGWKVRSVRDNGVGANAGVKTADVIKSIDGQSVTRDSKIRADGLRTIEVQREEKAITLSLRN